LLLLVDSDVGKRFEEKQTAAGVIFYGCTNADKVLEKANDNIINITSSGI